MEPQKKAIFILTCIASVIWSVQRHAESDKNAMQCVCANVKTFARLLLAMNRHSESQCTVQKTTRMLKNGTNKIQIIPLSIKHIGILLLSISSAFEVQRYFFFVKFIKGEANIVS